VRLIVPLRREQCRYYRAPDCAGVSSCSGKLIVDNRVGAAASSARKRWRNPHPMATLLMDRTALSALHEPVAFLSRSGLRADQPGATTPFMLVVFGAGENREGLDRSRSRNREDDDGLRRRTGS
jgi:hypothetical protein